MVSFNRVSAGVVRVEVFNAQAESIGVRTATPGRNVLTFRAKTLHLQVQPGMLPNGEVRTSADVVSGATSPGDADAGALLIVLRAAGN